LRQKSFGFALLLLSALALFAQENRYDVGIGISEVFSRSSSGNNTTLTPSNSPGFWATGRVRFTPHSSISLTYSVTTNSQKYFSAPFNYRIQGRVSEFGGAYVFSFHEKEKLEPFIFGGAAALVFNPNTTTLNDVSATIPAVRQTKPAFIYGGGADYRVRGQWLAVRLQYRGLVYKAPDFGVQNLFTGAYGHLAEPSVGVVVKF
jgi:outer membrane immunogenic protein